MGEDLEYTVSINGFEFTEFEADEFKIKEDGSKIEIPDFKNMTLTFTIIDSYIEYIKRVIRKSRRAKCKKNVRRRYK